MSDIFNPNAKNPNILAQLFGQLYDSKVSQDALFSMYGKLGGEAALSPDDFIAAQEMFAKNPLNVSKVSLGNSTTSPIGNTAKLLGANIKAHPYKAGLTGLNAVGNIAGLFDNDKALGQILGTAAGAIVPSLMGGFSPLGTVNAAMLGGNIGGLFDVLRSKSEQDKAERERMAKMPAKYTTY